MQGEQRGRPSLLKSKDRGIAYQPTSRCGLTSSWQLVWSVNCAMYSSTKNPS
jgi:hypothetical protein